MSNDFPDEGGEVRSIGRLQDNWSAILRSASTVVGVDIRGDGESGPGARSIKMPWMFVVYELKED